ncbi:amino acid ABC transporter permease [Robbsia andropogonis]|uniref:amino acid ABC transporter permease n=1 Tax=Robbsia andropogonis TaxID=28092 RepID=UPI002A6A3695|nr:amino acid ABC transporter permease [Robbsia andropogonis]
MQAILDNFFNWDVYVQVAPFLLRGLAMTIGLSLLVIPCGFAAGMVVAILSHHLRSRIARFLLAAYIDLFRAVPPLVLLIFIYFGAPFLGWDMPKLLAVAIGFMLNNSSYYGEVLRAGFESIPKGQQEAARSTGMSAVQTTVLIVIPQAVRTVLPELISNTIEVVKLTTIASVVALPELLRVARDAQSLLYNPSPIMLAALVYLAMLWPLVRLLRRFEQKHAT